MKGVGFRALLFNAPPQMQPPEAAQILLSSEFSSDENE
ncbi:hypothetical protein HNE_1478 [Hyphomonas neptunium ATCC 15444]|uniref:Uncharacterized protein n=2 Tax=Hyphomonas TaxID=85 RepID=Q0C251_HYPNA|nr:hypothetical protein HNE_1478 [Hyphomonas neptunium ATCC 15444]KCZ93096.1 hypothetical protein HHI_10434 [Hyphomonas hirschiana VP5]